MSATIRRAWIPSPIGDLLALASDRGLCALEFDGRRATDRSAKVSAERERSAKASAERAATVSPPERHARLTARLARWFAPHEIVDEPSPVLDRTREWLDQYFAGERADAGGVPLDMRGAPFELRVWAALREIPAGATSSYGAIAARLSAPGASRAVGAANGANPVSIIVPCHRVIGSSGALVGYGGGIERKKWLLDHEARWRDDSQLVLF